MVTGPDEQDLQLINALQIAPRASWQALARVLGSGAQTLARRWQRLSESGVAWVATYPGGRYADSVMAIVEVDCAARAQAEVVTALCADPRVVTVEESTQGCDLLLTVMTADLPEMSAFALDGLGRMAGLSRRRTCLATSVFHDGGHWRLRSLTREQNTQLQALEQRPESSSSRPPAQAWPLIQALAADGRRSARQIAEATGRNPATVRRQLPQLLRSGLLTMRCELAQPASSRPVSCTLRGRLDPSDAPRTIGVLRSLPNLRLAISTTGDDNFLMTVWVAELSEIPELETLLAERLPALTITRSGINLRTAKRVGWLLDEDGYSTGQVVTPTALRLR